MTNIFLTKILVGFFAVSLSSISLWILFKLINLIGSIVKFKLSFNDFMTICYIGIGVYLFYFIGDLLV